MKFIVKITKNTFILTILNNPFYTTNYQQWFLKSLRLHFIANILNDAFFQYKSSTMHLIIKITKKIKS